MALINERWINLTLAKIQSILAAAGTKVGIGTTGIAPLAVIDARGEGDILNCSNGANQDFKVNVSEVAAAIKRVLLTSSTPTKMQIGNNGGVGIEINETNSIVKILQQLQVAGGTPGVGKVLTSDASGLASWANPSGGTAILNQSGGSFSTTSLTPVVVTNFTFAVEANKKYQVFISGELRTSNSTYYAQLGLQTPATDCYIKGWKIVESSANTLAYQAVSEGGASTNLIAALTYTTANPPKASFCSFILIIGTTGGNVSLTLKTESAPATAYLSNYTMTLIG